ARSWLNADDIGVEPQVDAVFPVEAVRAQRHPVLWCVAGKVIFRKVRTVDRRRTVITEHDDAALVLLAAQHLGGGKSGGTAADDDDLGGRRSWWLATSFWRVFFCAHVNGFTAALHAPAGQ